MSCEPAPSPTSPPVQLAKHNEQDDDEGHEAAHDGEKPVQVVDELPGNLHVHGKHPLDEEKRQADGGDGGVAFHDIVGPIRHHAQLDRDAPEIRGGNRFQDLGNEVQLS